ncbi:tetratricopeptide repeat protein [Polaribacter sp. R77954]|uniref:tetratricopeptide repeat protein n=1 Tax=Polaribacter sp. R77954 TaxID=3093870 RepID=UPI0037C6FF5C
MKVRKKNIELSIKRTKHITIVLFMLCYVLFSHYSFSQDSIPEKEDLTEAAELKFQQFFFKALSQKSIGNHQKALENLENCNQIIANDVAVFFEFSKNYLALNNTLLAKEYLQRALIKEASNVWMLKHLVKIHQEERNYKKAIEVQQKVVALNPKERAYLVRLYLYNRQYDEAISLMNVLEEENALSANLKKLRNNLNSRKKIRSGNNTPNDIASLIHQFKTDKSYKILQEILNQSKNNPTQLIKFSEQGINLFPAQPFVYLIKARALNIQKNHKNALTTLQNGIDFVIDDKMEVDFYEEMAKAYKGLGNEKEEYKYQQKAKKLKS